MNCFCTNLIDGIQQGDGALVAQKSLVIFLFEQHHRPIGEEMREVLLLKMALLLIGIS